MITVEELMSVSVKTLTPTDTLADAKRMMKNSDIHHIPIVDDAGEVVGLVSHRDILAASESSLHEDDTVPGADVAIEEFRTRDVTTVDGRAGLRGAALFLQKNKYGCLPIVTDGQLKGIITDRDFVAIAIDLLEQSEQFEGEDF